MRNIIVSLILILSINTQLVAQDKTDIILQEIRNIKEEIKDIKQDIKVLREDMNKRFEQVDKRFEQVDRRLDFMQNILYALMGLIFSSPFIAIYLRDKKETEDKKNFDQIKSINLS